MTGFTAVAVDSIRSSAQRLPEIKDPSFASHFDKLVSNARVVCLGEASHGTSEFYQARAQMTKRLVEKYGFNIVAVEADWPDAASYDQYVRPAPRGKAHRTTQVAERPFSRFPRWMWRNEDVLEFVEWLRGWNLSDERESERKKQTGFYGLDLYSMNSSIRAVIDFLDTVDPVMAKLARKRYGCLLPWIDDPARYGAYAFTQGFAPCEEKVVRMLRDLLAMRLEYIAAEEPGGDGGGERFLDAEANARVVKDAEIYYRSMYWRDEQSWNLRDGHMVRILERLLETKGPGAKAVVWA